MKNKKKKINLMKFILTPTGIFLLYFYLKIENPKIKIVLLNVAFLLFCIDLLKSSPEVLRHPIKSLDAEIKRKYKLYKKFNKRLKKISLDSK